MQYAVERFVRKIFAVSRSLIPNLLKAFAHCNAKKGRTVHGCRSRQSVVIWVAMNHQQLSLFLHPAAPACPSGADFW